MEILPVIPFKMFALVKCLVVLTAAVAAHGFSLGPYDIVFHLYTRANPSQSEPLLNNVNSIMMSRFFSLSRNTVITCHSHNDEVSGNFNAFVVSAFINTEDVNVIAVDWSPGAQMYTHALGNAPQVGLAIAEFINILQREFGYSTNNVRIVGVGLGGHIAGIAARNVNGEIPSIVALDPSFHGWTHHPQRLNADDAGVVEVLHTTAGITGYDLPLGDLDFYPNGGSYQTGCGADASCSHIYAYAFYAESITRQVNGGNKFVGTACESYEEAVAQQCSGETDVIFGGTEVKTGSSGIYYFRTNNMPPFARG